MPAPDGPARPRYCLPLLHDPVDAPVVAPLRPERVIVDRRPEYEERLRRHPQAWGRALVRRLVAELGELVHALDTRPGLPDPLEQRMARARDNLAAFTTEAVS